MKTQAGFKFLIFIFGILLITPRAYGDNNEGNPALVFHYTYPAPPTPGQIPTYNSAPQRPSQPPPPPSPELSSLSKSAELHKIELQKLYDENRAQTAEYFSLVAQYQAERAAVVALEQEQRLSDAQLVESFKQARNPEEKDALRFSPNYQRYQIKENRRMLSEFEARWADKSKPTLPDYRVNAAILGGVMTEAANSALEDQLYQVSAMALEVGKFALNLAIDFSPAGPLKGALEGLSGYSMYGEKLTSFQRGLALASAIPFVSIANGLRSGLPAMAKVFGEGSKAAAEAIRLERVFNVPGISKALIADHEAVKVAEAVETKIDDLGAFFRKLKPSQLEDIAQGMGDPHAYDHMMSAAKKIEEVLGSEKASNIFMKMDPAVAVKTIQDLGDAQRAGINLNMFNGNADALVKYFNEAELLHKQILSGEPTKIFMKIDNASTLLVAKEGKVLETGLTRELPYLSNGGSSDFLNAAQGRKLTFVTSEERFVGEFSKGLKENQVSPAIFGELKTATLYPRQIRVFPSSNELGEVVGHVSDEVLPGLQYSGTGAKGIQFIAADGKVARFGSAGERYAGELKGIKDYSTPGYNVEAAFDGVATKARCPKGEVLMQAQRHGQEAVGRFFSPTRALNPKNADELSNLTPYENWARQQKTYVSKEEINGFFGKVAGGKGDQFWIPKVNDEGAEILIEDLFYEVRF